MIQRYYLHGGAYHMLAEGHDIPKDATEVPRLPEIGESWDDKARSFVTDHEIVADMTVPARHIDQAHAMKAAEASFILSGFTLTHGLLAAEAEATGVSIEDLAQAVFDKISDFRLAEAARRTTKVAARQGALEE